MDTSSIVISSFDGLTPNLDSIYQDSIRYTMNDWRLTQQSLVTASGAAAVAIPGLHLVGMAADVVFLMNRMSVCSYGIGSILGHNGNLGNMIEKEDFLIILARWSGDDSVGRAAVAKVAADMSTKVGGKLALKTLAKAMCINCGYLIGNKMSGKIGAKIGAKIGGKLAGKAAAGFVPFLGAAVGGGINLWFITSVADVADAWFKEKISVGSLRP